MAQNTISLGVIHTDLGASTKEYLMTLSTTLSSLSETKVDAVLVSTPVNPIRDVLIGKRKYGSYRHYLGSLLTRLGNLALKTRKHIILSPILRRAGNKLYMMSAILPPIGGPIIKGRKLKPINGVVSGGTDLDLITINGVNLCILMLDDIEVPEICRLCLYKGCDAFISIQPPILTERPPDLTIAISAVRAKENSTPVISIGGYVAEAIHQPTFIVRRDGSIADEISSFEPNVFEIEIPKLDRIEKKTMTKLYSKILKEIIR